MNMGKKKQAEYDEDNYVATKDEIARIRSEYLMGPMREYARMFMEDHPLVRSVLIKVSQYYNDEAEDAVHFQMYPSVLSMWSEPPPPAPFKNKRGQTITPTAPNYYHEAVPKVLKENLPFVPWRFEYKRDEDDYSLVHARTLFDFVYRWEERTFGWNHWLKKAAWYSNADAIPLFAAYCTEEGRSDGYVPLCVYRKVNDNVEMEFLGTMYRPEVDGLSPVDSDYEEDDEDSEETEEPFFKYTLEAIAKCSQRVTDPVELMRAHVQRRDLLSRDDERAIPLNLVGWNLRGPYIFPDDTKRVAEIPEALRELHDEWNRRKQWDAEFAEKYGKK
jgi:hypothetical protein